MDISTLSSIELQQFVVRRGQKIFSTPEERDPCGINDSRESIKEPVGNNQRWMIILRVIKLGQDS